MKNVVTSLLLVLSVASIAEAQELSARERAYVDGLAATLGPIDRAERVAFRWTATVETGIAAHVESLEGQSEAGPQLRVSGVRAEAGAVIVRRFKLADVDAARWFAAHHELGAEAPLVGELRGDQVVFVHGEPVRDASFARRALDAAWRGLPVLAPSAEATFANLGDADLVAATTTHQGPIAASVLNTFTKAREVAGRQQPGCKAVMHGPTDVSVQLEQGLTAAVHSDESGNTWMWSTGALDRAAAMARYFEVLTGRASGGDATPTTNQRDGLEDVLTRTHASTTSGGSIMANDGSVPPAPFPMGDEITAEVSKQVRDQIDAAIRREVELPARQAAKELEAARAGEWSEWSPWSSGKREVVVDRPLGE